MKKKKLTAKERKELAWLIWAIEVYGQTSTNDMRRKTFLESKLNDSQAEAVDNLMESDEITEGADEAVGPSEERILEVLEENK